MKNVTFLGVVFLDLLALLVRLGHVERENVREVARVLDLR